MRIVLPWPPAELSPNGSQGDFHGKAAAARRYKAECVALTRESGKGLKRLPSGVMVYRVAMICCPPRAVRYDLDNMAKRTKQGLDAIAEAIGVDDGLWRSLLIERGDVCKGGGVVVEIYTAPIREAVVLPVVGVVS